MNWKPLGHIFRTDSYAQTPTPLVLPDRVRVYYASRENGKAMIEFVDLDLDDPTKIVSAPSGRVLANGKLLAFDQDGQMPSFADQKEDGIYLYYSGWLALQNGYQNATGLARSVDDGRTFARVFEGPMLDRTPAEPYLAVTPCIAGKSIWREMFYISGLRWEMIDGRCEPIYAIRLATENMDVFEEHAWSRNGPLVIPQLYPEECFSRPWVFGRGRGERMLYSYRSAHDYRDGAGSYRIGSAKRHAQNYAWKRIDGEFNLPRTPGFDDTMTCYAATFDVKGKTFMVYNGNTFGKHGFALAVMQ